MIDRELIGLILKKITMDSENDHWCGYSQLHDYILEESGKSYLMNEIKAGVKRLSERGLIKLETTYRDEWRFCGRGWFLK